MTPLKTVLTKGCLEEKTVTLLEKMGYNYSQVYNKGRCLILPTGDGEIEVVLAKAADVITYVQYGVCDLGIVDKDTIMESVGGSLEVLNLGFDRYRFAVAGPKDSGIFEGYPVKTVATKYPKVARAFSENRDMDAYITRIESSVELAPLLGLAEAIVDLAGTGTTLKENGFETPEIVCPTSVRLIISSAMMKLRKDEVEALVSRVSQTIQRKEEKVCLRQSS